MSDFKKEKNSYQKPTASVFTGMDTRGLYGSLGSAACMKNMRISGTGELVKRGGYSLYCTFDRPVRNAWYGRVGNSADALYAVCGGKVERFSAGAVTTIGNVSENSRRPAMFIFSGHLYITDGIALWEYDGVDFHEVSPYVPLIRFENTDGTTRYEQRNMLTNAAHAKFTPSESNIYYIEGDIASVQEVYYQDRRLSASEYSYGTASGGCAVTVTAETNPTRTNSLDIYFTYVDKGYKRTVSSCRSAMSDGLINDSKVFLFGGNDGNRIYYSGTVNSNPSMSYFPIDNYIDIGDGRWNINSVLRQYDHLMIFTDRETWCAYPENLPDSSSGLIKYSYQTHSLNSTIGGAGFEHARQIENQPMSVMHSGVYKWNSRNDSSGQQIADYISAPIENELDFAFLCGSVTFDCRKYGEFWVAFGDTVYAYNYRLGVWYCYDNIEADMFLDIGGDAAFCTQNEVFVFADGCDTDDGDEISAEFEGRWFDFESPELFKKAFRFFASGSGGIAQITIETDRGNTVTFPVNFTSSDSRDVPKTVRKRLDLSKFGCLKVLINSISGGVKISQISLGYSQRGEIE